MPIGTTSTLCLFAVGIVGVQMAVIGAFTSDSVAAWVGMATVVSAGVLTVVKNWREMWRREAMQDMGERIRVLEESNRELDRLRKLECERFSDAEKTFESIRNRLLVEIDSLRRTIDAMDRQDGSREEL